MSYGVQALWGKMNDIIKKPVCNDELVVRTAEKSKLSIGGFV